MKKTATLFLASLFSLASFSQNKGLQFDGQNDYVQAPEKSGVLTGGTMTFEAWIKPSNFNNRNSYIVNKGDNGYTWFCLTIMKDDMGMPGEESQTMLHAFISSWEDMGELHFPISTTWLNQWHHVVLMADGSAFKLFVDGVMVTSTPFNGNLPLTGQALHLGASSNWGN
ncbi:MAG: LamG domain-containing protein, partial [Chitinophagaceae bacterium]